MKRILAPSTGVERAARRIGLGAVLLVLLVDRLTKLRVIDSLGLGGGETYPLLPFFDLTLVWNEGISLGLFQQGTDMGRWLLIGLTGAISLFLGYLLLRTRERFPACAFGLILGGALGNIWDRIQYGAVADFLHFFLGSWSFYIFNVADAAITVGVLFLLVDGFQPARDGPEA